MTIPGQLKTHAAIIYTRVSGNEQAEHGTSLESQRDACRAKALSLALPVSAEYEDAGTSGGFLLSRGGMQAALADIHAGRADTLICASISRYSRDTEHQQSIKKAVQAAGGRLVFCDMDFDDTPEGDLAFGIMGNFAEYERKSIATRTEKGRRKRAEQGKQPARARAPYGYHVVGKADVLRGDHPADLCGQYLVIEPEAEIVRAMFDRYTSGTNTLSGLARWLNENGILPGTRQSIGLSPLCTPSSLILSTRVRPATEGTSTPATRLASVRSIRIQGGPLRRVTSSAKPLPEPT